MVAQMPDDARRAVGLKHLYDVTDVLGAAAEHETLPPITPPAASCAGTVKVPAEVAAPVP